MSCKMMMIVHTHTYIHTYIYTYTYTHTHIHLFVFKIDELEEAEIEENTKLLAEFKEGAEVIFDLEKDCGNAKWEVDYMQADYWIPMYPGQTNKNLIHCTAWTTCMYVCVCMCVCVYVCVCMCVCV